MAGNFSYTDLIGPGIGVLGSYLAARPQNKYAEQQRELQQGELARRNNIQGAMSPMLARWMGMRDPQQIARYTQAVNGPTTPTAQPSGGGGGGGAMNTIGNAAGIGMTGLNVASKFGLLGGGAGAASAALPGAISGTLGGTAGALGLTSAGAPMALGGTAAASGGGAAGGIAPLLTNPWTIGIGGGIAAGIAAKKLIGRGRKTADKATADSGYEGQLKNTLTQMAAQGGSLQDLERAYQQYLAATQGAMAAGGNKKKVAQQSLSNQALQGTYQRLRQQLGGQ